MPGTFLRSVDGLTEFEAGPQLFTGDMRHSAVRVDGHRLNIFYSNAHDCPERILMSVIDLRPDWWQWRSDQPVTVLEPEMDYEGANCPLVASVRGSVHKRVRQLRDPAVYEENGSVYLLYAVAGESGIAIAQLVPE
jgi:hypothetical protein